MDRPRNRRPPETLSRLNGDLLTATQYAYVTNGSTVPYTSLESSRWQYVYDGVTSQLRALGPSRPAVPRDEGVRRTPGVANLWKPVNYGDYDVTGDEKTLTYEHNPNAGRALVVGLPSVTPTRWR